jgi:hypothetical protein
VNGTLNSVCRTETQFQSIQLNAFNIENIIYGEWT